MPELPSGTVTFLFTDIEGSTRLLEEHGEGYAELLGEHRRVLRKTFGRHRGVEVDTQGDAFFVAFPSASHALAAAAEAQRRLELPVRMGIHTGEPQVVDGGYVGIDVHRAARICAAAHGGQVVVSETTHRLAGNDGALRDLGEHRLKDLGNPVRLFQLGDDNFPPLRTLNQTNLPAQPNPLVGREREVSELTQLLGEARLVTLTGPGGSGKTRLALEVGAELVERFDGGVFWVPLAAVVDPELVEPAIAQTLGAQSGLAQHVALKEMLLLLDNLEQVLEAAPRLSELLEQCTNLRLLVTSRALLRVAGERDYPVDPLAEDDAVALFRERAATAEPIEAVHEICRRLDRLPLAVELAAARTRLLPPSELLERLERALPILTGGRRDAPERQRTLRATIEWSYDLLGDEEQRLFRRLAVFAGSFTVEAAEAVCDADLETLDALLEQSLVRRWASGRLGMLETIREYAEEQLEASAEAADLRRRHAEFFLELAKSANLQVEAIGTAPQRHDLVIPEQANLRAAIDWAAEANPELALRIAVALENFWVTNNPHEGVRRLGQLLARAESAPLRLRAQATRALGGSTQIAGAAGRPEVARDLYEEGRRMFVEAGDERGAAVMLFRTGTTLSQMGEVDSGRRLVEESLEAFERLGYDAGRCQALGVLGSIHLRVADTERGRQLTEEAAALAHDIGFTWWEANNLGTLAEVALDSGDLDKAERSGRVALTLLQRIGDRVSTIYMLGLLAACAASRGHVERSGTLWGATEAEELRRPTGGGWEEEKTKIEEKLRCVEGPAFDLAARAGKFLSLDESVEYALSDD